MVISYCEDALRVRATDVSCRVALMHLDVPQDFSEQVPR